MNQQVRKIEQEIADDRTKYRLIFFSLFQPEKEKFEQYFASMPRTSEADMRRLTQPSPEHIILPNPKHLVYFRLAQDPEQDPTKVYETLIRSAPRTVLCDLPVRGLEGLKCLLATFMGEEGISALFDESINPLTYEPRPNSYGLLLSYGFLPHL